MKYARYLPSEHRRETWKELITNEEVEYEVILAYDNGVSEFIHRVEKSGKQSI